MEAPITDERIADVIASYHGSIKAMAKELQERRKKDIDTQPAV